MNKGVIKESNLKVNTACSMNKSFHAEAVVSILLDVKWGPCCITEMLLLISSLFKLWCPWQQTKE